MLHLGYAAHTNAPTLCNVTPLRTNTRGFPLASTGPVCRAHVSENTPGLGDLKMKGKGKHCPSRRTPAREGVGFRTSRRGEEGPTSPGIKVEPLCISPHCSTRVCTGNVLMCIASGRIRSDLYSSSTCTHRVQYCKCTP